MQSIPRRDFLRISNQIILSLAGLLGIGALVRFLGYQSQHTITKEFDLGSANDYPSGSRTVLADIPALLNHDTQGFAAFSLICPHLGCTVESISEGFECPCHGSQFDRTGTVYRGPASMNLRPLRVVENEAGHLILYTE